MMKKIFPFFLSLLGSVCAQDIHFSQFGEVPLHLNPSLTGVFPGDQRVAVQYKNQWQFIGAPYRTYAFSADAGLLKRKWSSGYLGSGLFVFNDVAGDTKLGTTQANLLLSAIVFLAKQHQLSAGIEGGIVQHSLKGSGSDLRWASQYSNGRYNESIPGEYTQFPSFLHSDFSAGLAWQFSSTSGSSFSNESAALTAGVSLHHINKPGLQFIPKTSDRMNAKVVAHASGQIGLKNTNMALQPSLLYALQGNQNEAVAGFRIRYQLREGSNITGFVKETALILGGYYRFKDALIPVVLIEYSNFAAGISYDITTSGLTSYSHGRGGVEISLRYINPSPFQYSPHFEKRRSLL